MTTNEIGPQSTITLLADWGPISLVLLWPRTKLDPNLQATLWSYYPSQTPLVKCLVWVPTYSRSNYSMQQRLRRLPKCTIAACKFCIYSGEQIQWICIGDHQNEAMLLSPRRISLGSLWLRSQKTGKLQSFSFTLRLKRLLDFLERFLFRCFRFYAQNFRTRPASQI